MVEIRFRSYRPEDLSAMHALDVICFQKPFRFARSAMRRFAEARNARVVLAEENETLAGFVILHLEHAKQTPVGYIVTLDVAPQQRRRGLARALMREVEHAASREGATAILLHVFEGNDPAIRFYQSNGFVRSHREPDFYGSTMDAWVFQKLLPLAAD